MRSWLWGYQVKGLGTGWLGGVAVLAGAIVVATGAPAVATEEPCTTRSVSVADHYQREGGQLAGGRLIFEVTTAGCAAGSVDYRTPSVVALGRATEQVDYQPATGSLTWARGDTTSRTVTVPVVGDLVVEADELLNLMLVNPTYGVTLVDPNAVGTIINDDQTMVVPDGEPICWLVAYQCLVTFGLSQEADRDVTIFYSTSDGTATAGEDYVAVPSGTVVIPAGRTSAAAKLSYLADRRMIFPEYFHVDIIGASLGTIEVSRVQVTIPAP